MATNLATLHEIAVKYATKQPGMVDDLTEETPILKMVQWRPSNGGLTHTAERLYSITGPGFTKFDAPLPYMDVDSELVTTELGKIGGIMEVASDRAMQLGGPQQYFAEKQPFILKKFGMDTEYRIILYNWLKAAIESDNVTDCGGTGRGWFLLAVRFDAEVNCGLYDVKQFASGRFFDIAFLHDGGEDYMRKPGYEGVLGYGIVYRSRFGYMQLDPKRTVAAIVNIDETHRPTVTMIDDMLAQVRQNDRTYLFTSPRGKIYGINPYKEEKVQLVNNDNNALTVIDSWNGVRIVTSHNIAEKIDHITV